MSIINNNKEGPDFTRASGPALTATGSQSQCVSARNNRCPQDIAEGPVQSPVQPHVNLPSTAYGTLFQF